MSLGQYFGVTILALVCTIVSSEVGYHEAVGIPTAKTLKKIEDEIFANKNDSVSFRIIGGSETSPNVYPFVAGLVMDLVGMSDQSFCTASLLTVNRLVTAAHCWWDGIKQAWQVTVVLGSQHVFHGGSRIKTSTVITHPQYNAFAQQNDIAIIHLPMNVVFNDVNIAPIDLPRNDELDRSFAGEWATIIGYGKISDRKDAPKGKLNHVNVQVISVAECSMTFEFTTATRICTSGAGHKGVCNGDSGGPLVIFLNGRLVLIGVTSLYMLVGCEAGGPSAFTRVTAFYDFITSQL